MTTHHALHRPSDTEGNASVPVTTEMEEHQQTLLSNEEAYQSAANDHKTLRRQWQSDTNIRLQDSLQAHEAAAMSLLEKENPENDPYRSEFARQVQRLKESNQNLRQQNHFLEKELTQWRTYNHHSIIDDLEEQVQKWEILYQDSAEVGSNKIERLEQELRRIRALLGTTSDEFELVEMTVTSQDVNVHLTPPQSPKSDESKAEEAAMSPPQEPPSSPLDQQRKLSVLQRVNVLEDRLEKRKQAIKDEQSSDDAMTTTESEGLSSVVPPTISETDSAIHQKRIQSLEKQLGVLTNRIQELEQVELQQTLEVETVTRSTAIDPILEVDQDTGDRDVQQHLNERNYGVDLETKLEAAEGLQQRMAASEATQTTLQSELNSAKAQLELAKQQGDEAVERLQTLQQDHKMLKTRLERQSYDSPTKPFLRKDKSSQTSGDHATMNLPTQSIAASLEEDDTDDSQSAHNDHISTSALEQSPSTQTAGEDTTVHLKSIPTDSRSQNEEVRSLQEQNNSLQAQVASLEASLQGYEEEVIGLRKDLDESRNNHDRLQEELDAQVQIVESAEVETVRLKGEISMAQVHKNDMEHAVQKLQEENQALRRQQMKEDTRVGGLERGVAAQAAGNDRPQQTQIEHERPKNTTGEQAESSMAFKEQSVGSERATQQALNYVKASETGLDVEEDMYPDPAESGDGVVVSVKDRISHLEQSKKNKITPVYPRTMMAPRHNEGTSQERLQSLEIEVKRLQDRRKLLQYEMEDLQVSFQSNSDEDLSIENEKRLLTLEAEVDRLQGEKKLLQAEVEKLQDHTEPTTDAEPSSEMEERLRALETEVDRLHDEKKTLEAEIEELQRSLDSKTQEASKWQETADKANGALKELQARHRKVARILENKERELMEQELNASKTVSILETQLEDATSQWHAVEDELGKSQSLLEVREQQKADVETWVPLMVGEMKASEKHISNLKEQMAQLNEDNRTRDEKWLQELAKKQQQVGTSKDRASLLEKELLSLTQNLNTERNKMKQRVADLQLQVLERETTHTLMIGSTHEAFLSILDMNHEVTMRERDRAIRKQGVLSSMLDALVTASVKADESDEQGMHSELEGGNRSMHFCTDPDAKLTRKNSLRRFDFTDTGNSRENRLREQVAELGQQVQTLTANLEETKSELEQSQLLLEESDQQRREGDLCVTKLTKDLKTSEDHVSKLSQKVQDMLKERHALEKKWEIEHSKLRSELEASHQLTTQLKHDLKASTATLDTDSGVRVGNAGSTAAAPSQVRQTSDIGSVEATSDEDSSVAITTDDDSDDSSVEQSTEDNKYRDYGISAGSAESKAAEPSQMSSLQTNDVAAVAETSDEDSGVAISTDDDSDDSSVEQSTEDNKYRDYGISAGSAESKAAEPSQMSSLQTNDVAAVAETSDEDSGVAISTDDDSDDSSAEITTDDNDPRHGTYVGTATGENDSSCKNVVDEGVPDPLHMTTTSNPNTEPDRKTIEATPDGNSSERTVESIGQEIVEDSLQCNEDTESKESPDESTHLGQQNDEATIECTVQQSSVKEEHIVNEEVAVDTTSPAQLDGTVEDDSNNGHVDAVDKVTNPNSARVLGSRDVSSEQKKESADMSTHLGPQSNTATADSTVQPDFAKEESDDPIQQETDDESTNLEPLVGTVELTNLEPLVGTVELDPNQGNGEGVSEEVTTDSSPEVPTIAITEPDIASRTVQVDCGTKGNLSAPEEASSLRSPQSLATARTAQPNTPSTIGAPVFTTPRRERPRLTPPRPKVPHVYHRREGREYVCRHPERRRQRRNRMRSVHPVPGDDNSRLMAIGSKPSETNLGVSIPTSAVESKMSTPADKATTASSAETWKTPKPTISAKVVARRKARTRKRSATASFKSIMGRIKPR